MSLLIYLNLFDWIYEFCKYFKNLVHYLFIYYYWKYKLLGFWKQTYRY